ncbi:MAG: class I SAM-dependent methyltransferase [Bryobacterales bacterium]|nr:class I SAM-dependent methyltransferase [Bryobacterales bacterium]
MVECTGCGLIRLFPWPSPAELEKYYPPAYWFAPGDSLGERLEQHYRRFVLRDHIRFVFDALGHAGGSGRLLDVGCGGGLFLGMMKERGAKVAGLDFSPDAARVAWSANQAPAVAGALELAPFAPQSWSVITMFHVLEHLYDPMSYLESARQLLEPEGRLVVQVPNAACWQFLLFGENWSGVDIPRHLIDFRDKDLDILLENAGFEVLRHKYFNLRDNPAAMATTLAPGLDPMARRVRRAGESAAVKMLKDALYLGLIAASLPFTIVEAMCRAGATVMVEARKKP